MNFPDNLHRRHCCYASALPCLNTFRHGCLKIQSDDLSHAEHAAKMSFLHRSNGLQTEVGLIYTSGPITMAPLTDILIVHEIVLAAVFFMNSR